MSFEHWLGMQTTPATPATAPLSNLYDEPKAAVCWHCKTWTGADDVWLALPHMDRCICLACYTRITGTQPRIRPDVRQAAGEAAASEKPISDGSY